MVMMSKNLKALHSYLEDSKLRNCLLKSYIENDELNLIIATSQLIEAVKFLYDDKKCLFKMLMSISGVDYLGRDKRFEVVYHLLSIELNLRLRLKIQLEEEEIAPSLTGLFAAAGWYEREVWDMFGIAFAEHPDLRRILTDYGFEGHPLRKDFPLTGFNEVRYDLNVGKVIYEPVTLTQDFRNFDFQSPWQGVSKALLPGDEKTSKEK